MERTTEASSRAPTGFHDLDELLLGPTELEAMPFEFGCDFASAFEDKHLDVDAPAPSHRSSSSSSRPKEAKRSHKRKSDSLAPRSLPLFTAPPAALDTNTPGAVPMCETTALGSTQIGRWTKKEHELFLEGLRLYGKSWKKISSLVVTRTLVQIRTHAQKYLQKQTKSAMKAAAAAAAGASSTVPAKTRKAASHVEQATWKHHHHHHNHASVFLPIAFPEHVAGSSPSSSSASSSLSSSSSSSSSAFVHHKDLGLPSISSMSKLDQLLHDDSSQAATGHDDYYSSPTGTDDELVQWLQHRHLPYLSSPAAPKRRRTDASSAWAMVNPMEAMAAHNSVPHASGYYSSHGQQSTATSSDFLPPLSAYASSLSSTTVAASHSDTEYTFSSPWL